MDIEDWITNHLARLPARFYGKVVLNVQGGQVKHINVEQSIRGPVRGGGGPLQSGYPIYRRADDDPPKRKDGTFALEWDGEDEG